LSPAIRYRLTAWTEDDRRTSQFVGRGDALARRQVETMVPRRIDHARTEPVIQRKGRERDEKMEKEHRDRGGKVTRDQRLWRPSCIEPATEQAAVSHRPPVWSTKHQPPATTDYPLGDSALQFRAFARHSVKGAAKSTGPRNHRSSNGSGFTGKWRCGCSLVGVTSVHATTDGGKTSRGL